MKKLVLLALVLCMALSLVACGSKTDAPASGGGSSSGGDSGSGDIDLNEVAANMIEEAEELNSFSFKAALNSIAARGLSQADVEPKWDYVVDDEKNQAYGDSSHGVIRFSHKGEELTAEGEYDAWKKQLFDATAKASDDGYNIEGFSWGNGDVEMTWDDFANKEGMLETWSYRYNGTIMDVYVKQTSLKDSEYVQGDDGQYDFVYYYNAMQVDIADGIQKSWDETWADLESAFEEYGDEIEDALRDYTD